VPRGLGGREAAPAILDFLILGQRVVDARKDLEVFVEDARQLVRAAASRLSSVSWLRSVSIPTFWPSRSNSRPPRVSSKSLFQAEAPTVD
jgi:hypothetical protein